MRDMRGVIIEEGDTIAYGKSSRYNSISIGEVVSISEKGVEVLGEGNCKTGFLPSGERIIVLPSYYKEKVVDSTE